MGLGFPAIDLLSHDAGQLLSALFIAGGFWLLSSSRPVLYAAQRAGTMARTGAYASVRDPQYVAFVLIIYARLAAREEAGMRARHGPVYDDDAARTSRFVPLPGAGRRKPAG